MAGARPPARLATAEAGPPGSPPPAARRPGPARSAEAVELLRHGRGTGCGCGDRLEATSLGIA